MKTGIYLIIVSFALFFLANYVVPGDDLHRLVTANAVFTHIPPWNGGILDEYLRLAQDPNADVPPYSPGGVAAVLVANSSVNIAWIIWLIFVVAFSVLNYSLMPLPTKISSTRAALTIGVLIFSMFLGLLSVSSPSIKFNAIGPSYPEPTTIMSFKEVLFTVLLYLCTGLLSVFATNYVAFLLNRGKMGDG